MTVSNPLAGPVTEGTNVIETVQFDPTASVAGQLGVAENPPVAEILLRFSGAPPKLAIVTVCGTLLLPTFCVKLKEEGVRLMAEGRCAGKGTGVIPKT